MQEIVCDLRKLRAAKGGEGCLANATKKFRENLAQDSPRTVKRQISEN